MVLSDVGELRNADGMRFDRSAVITYILVSGSTLNGHRNYMHNLKVMNNKWSIWASVLMLTGILGLVAVNLERFHRRHQTPPDNHSLTDRTDQHFSLYDDNGQIKSDRQLRREQQARLKADSNAYRFTTLT